MTTINFKDAQAKPPEGVMARGDRKFLDATQHLLRDRANADRLESAMAEADASLPHDARILGPHS